MLQKAGAWGEWTVSLARQVRKTGQHDTFVMIPPPLGGRGPETFRHADLELTLLHDETTGRGSDLRHALPGPGAWNFQPDECRRGGVRRPSGSRVPCRCGGRADVVPGQNFEFVLFDLKPLGRAYWAT